MVFSPQGGFEFDTGLHYVGGNITDENSQNARLWKMVSAEPIKWAPMEDAYDIAVFGAGADSFPFRCGEERAKADLKRKFPEEERAIDAYYAEVYGHIRAHMQIFQNMSIHRSEQPRRLWVCGLP